MGTAAGTMKTVSRASVHMDALRGLAAMVVFLSHTRSIFLKAGLRNVLEGTAENLPSAPASVPEPMMITHWRISQLWFGNVTIGHLAVIVFFVLSGYLVGGSVLRSMRKNSFLWRPYLKQRLTRLWVVLLPALLLGGALDGIGMHVWHGAHNLYSGLSGTDIAPGLAARTTIPVFLGNVFFLHEILTFPFGTNIPLWSLSYEFWYYIAFPLLVTICMASNSPRVRVKTGLVLLLLLVFFGWRISGYFSIWLLGVAVALLPLSIPSRWRRAAMTISGTLVLLTMFLEIKLKPVLLLSDVVLGFIFSIFLWTVLHAQEPCDSGLYRSSAHGLSSMSYTLYLVHYPLLVFISALLMPVWQPWAITLVSLIKVSAICIIVLSISWVMYYCFERNTGKVRAWLSFQQLSDQPPVLHRNAKR